MVFNDIARSIDADAWSSRVRTTGNQPPGVSCILREHCHVPQTVWCSYDSAALRARRLPDSFLASKIPSVKHLEHAHHPVELNLLSETRSDVVLLL
jgi:hypothetical protein